jgi:hypothetical protein
VNTTSGPLASTPAPARRLAQFVAATASAIGKATAPVTLDLLEMHAKRSVLAAGKSLAAAMGLATLQKVSASATRT